MFVCAEDNCDQIGCCDGHRCKATGNLRFAREDYDAERRLAIQHLIHGVGEDLSRGGLADTPLRAAKAWGHWMSGYDVDPASLLKTFEDGAENYDEMVIVSDIPFYSMCEHHLAPFFGRAAVGYIPCGKVVGLSKLNRLVDAFARRLQTQERITQQIANTIQDVLKPIGVGVILKARHMCIESRGIAQQGTITTTSSMLGAIHEGAARAEFISLAKFQATI